MRAAPASMGSASLPALSASPFVWAVPAQARWPPRPRIRRRCTRPCHHRPPPPTVNGRAGGGGREGRAKKRARARERELLLLQTAVWARAILSTRHPTTTGEASPAPRPPSLPLSAPSEPAETGGARERHRPPIPAAPRTAPASLAKLAAVSNSTPHWKVLQPLDLKIFSLTACVLARSCSVSEAPARAVPRCSLCLRSCGSLAGAPGGATHAHAKLSMLA